MSDAENEGELAALALRLRRLDNEAPGRSDFRGRGIVIAAGGSRVFTNAYVLVSILRGKLGCKLPIQIWHFGAAEMSPTMAHLLNELGAETVDAQPRAVAAGLDIRNGWQLKPFCLQQCRFEEVLLLDADQVPVTDPSGMFDWTEYRETGAVFWPDIVGIRADNPIWRAMGLPPETPEMSFESGQILVDKQRHWKPLAAAIELNRHAELTYRYVYGDKDTFLLAFRISGHTFSLVPHAPFQAPRWMAQRDFNGNPLFQHLTQSKWSFASDDPPGEGFQGYEHCRDALQKLRQRWNGRVFNAPDRSNLARDTEGRLVSARLHRLEVVGEERTELELLPFGEIGAGRSVFRQNWWCEEKNCRVTLAICDADRVTYRLTLQADGSWAGQRDGHQSSTVTLSEIGTPPAEPSVRPGLADELLRVIGFPHHTEVDWARFAATVEILARADPGFLARMREIADATEGAGRDALEALVTAAERPAASWKSQQIDLNVLKTRYRPLVDLGNG